MAPNRGAKQKGKSKRAGLSRQLVSHQAQPLAYGRVMRTGAATTQNRNGSLVVKNRELMFSITGTTSLTTTSNIVTTHWTQDTKSWLADVAHKFEFAEFLSLVFVYEPYIATTTAGFVTAYFDYDAADPASPEIGDLLAQRGATSGPAHMPFRMAVPCRDITPRKKFTQFRGGSAEDIRLTAPGCLHFTTDNFSASTPCGYVYIEYEVKLSVPQTVNLSAVGLTRAFMFTKNADQGLVHNQEDRIDYFTKVGSASVPFYEQMGAKLISSGILKVAANTAIRAFLNLSLQKGAGVTAASYVVRWLSAWDTASLLSSTPLSTNTVQEGNIHTHDDALPTSSGVITVPIDRFLVNNYDQSRYYAAYILPTSADDDMILDKSTTATFTSL